MYAKVVGFLRRRVMPKTVSDASPPPKNPTTFAYIDLKRFDYGARFSVSRPVPLGSLEQRLTAGVDFQRQRDDRLNFNNVGGQPGPLRQLDQLEHVTEVGPFIQSALQP